MLSRLRPAEAHELVHHLAADTSLTSSELAVVVERGDGIPLFIEELVKAAQERGPSGVGAAVPENLQQLLASRLDRLGPARKVAQLASVLGREFPLALLEAAALVPAPDLAHALSRLEEAGLMSTQTGGDQVECVFRHGLIQDAAYTSLLRRQQQDLHAHVARVLEERFDGAVQSTPDLLAHHLAASGQQLHAADWYERAGRRAAERAAFGEAVEHYRRGLATLDPASPGRERSSQLLSLNILMANALMGSSGLGGADLLPIWEDAIALAEELGDQEELTSALNGAAVYHADRGDDDVAIGIAERIVDIADASGSRAAALRGNGTLGMERFFRAEGAQALAHLETAMSLSRPGDFESITYGVGHDEGVFFHTVASWNLWWLGRPDAGLAVALDGSRQANSLPSSLSQAMACHAVALIRHLRCEAEEARALAVGNLRLTEELGLPFWRGLALLVLGVESARSGDETGQNQLDLGLELLIEEGNRGGASFSLAMLADAQVHLGRYEQAIATVDAGLSISAELRQPFYDPELLRLKAIALDRDGRNRPEVLALLDDSLGLAQRLGAASWALRTCTTLATLPGRDEPSVEQRRTWLADTAHRHGGRPRQRRAARGATHLA